MTSALAILLWLVSAADAAKVSLHRDGGVYHVQGEFQVAAPPAAAWAVVTDYGGIGRFASSIRKSRVVGREPGGALIVEQVGTGSFLFMSRRLAIALRVRELPFEKVYFEQIGREPFAFYEGSWTLTATRAGCRVVYELAVEPGEQAGPGFVAARAIPRNVSRQLDEVRAEIERRAGP